MNSGGYREKNSLQGFEPQSRFQVQRLRKIRDNSYWWPYTITAYFSL